MYFLSNIFIVFVIAFVVVYSFSTGFFKKYEIIRVELEALIKVILRG